MTKNEELYDVYLELSKASGILSYAQSAVRLAERNQVDSFLAKLPEPPVLSQEGGVYDSKIELTVTVPDPDAEIMVEERKDRGYGMDFAPRHDTEIKYSWILTEANELKEFMTYYGKLGYGTYGTERQDQGYELFYNLNRA